MERIEGTGGGSRLAMRRLHHSGVQPVRALLIGDRAHLLADVGGAALAERAADRMWLATRHGVDLDVLTDLAPVLRAVQGVFRTWRLWRYDVVLVALGEGLDVAAAARARSRGSATCSRRCSRTPPTRPRSSSSARRSASPEHHRHVAAPEDRLQAVGRPARAPRASASGPSSPSTTRSSGRARGRRRSARRSPRPCSATTRRTAPARPRRCAPGRTTSRSGSGRSTTSAIVGSAPDPRLDDLVELARTAFGTESAEINFIDHDRQWKMAVAGAGARREPPGALLLRADDPARRAHGRERRPPRPRAAARARSCAARIRSGSTLAHPIESADGYRIGSFCVYDPSRGTCAGSTSGCSGTWRCSRRRRSPGVDAAPAGRRRRRSPTADGCDDRPVLVEPADLVPLLHDPRLVLLDVRWRLDAPDGRPAHRAGHLPGAVYVDLDHELAGPPRAGGGPAPAARPGPAAGGGAAVGRARRTARSSSTTTSAGCRRRGRGGCCATAGVQDVRVLDGGLAAWRRAGLPLEQGDVVAPAGRRADRARATCP